MKPIWMSWKAICFGAACSIAAGSSAQAQDIPVPANVGVDNMVGAVVVSTPDYEGSDDQTFGAAPVGKFKYDQNRYVLLQGNRFFWNISNRSDWELGFKGVYRLGRDDDVDDSAVKLMREIDDSLELGAFIGWSKKFNNDPRHRFNASIGFTQDVSDGHEGYVVEAGMVYWQPVARPLDLGIRGGFSYASDDYMSSYFGVSGADAAASGLPAFSADSGFKDVSLSLMGVYHFSKKWHLGAGLNYKKLLNNASDSPVVDTRGDDDQFIFGLALLYTW